MTNTMTSLAMRIKMIVYHITQQQYTQRSQRSNHYIVYYLAALIISKAGCYTPSIKKYISLLCSNLFSIIFHKERISLARLKIKKTYYAFTCIYIIHNMYNIYAILLKLYAALRRSRVFLISLNLLRAGNPEKATTYY